MTITEFLLARIDEDEAAARAGVSSQADPENGWGYNDRALTPHVGIIHEAIQAAHIIRWHPYRVLAECETKRRIVELSRPRHYTNPDDSWYSCGAAQLGVDTDNPDALGGVDGDCTCGFNGTTPILKALAAAYADHSDYDEAWRP